MQQVLRLLFLLVEQPGALTDQILQVVGVLDQHVHDLIHDVRLPVPER